MCSRLWTPLQHPSLLLGISRRPQILSLESVGSEIPAFSTAEERGGFWVSAVPVPHGEVMQAALGSGQ